MKRKNLKSIVEKYLKEVSEYVKSGENISNSVKKVFAKHGEQYEDSHRRCFSKALEKEEITDNKVKSLPIEHTEEYKDALNRCLSKSKYYLITWAQAETAIHEGFWDNLKVYAKFLGAEIIVQAGRYKNPNSIESSNDIKRKEQNKNIWDLRLKDYLYASRLTLCKGLQVLCDVKVMPTAMLPLSGLDGFTSTNSTILPHPKVHLKSLPILEGYDHKLSLSTGAVTVPNYTDTKAGKKGEFHHQIGFTIVEVDEDETFHIRQIQADDDGSFYDLFYKVDENGVTDVTPKIKTENYTLILGDTHGESVCKPSLEAAINLGHRLKVKNVVGHDTNDGKSVNPHEDKDPFILLEKEEEGTDNLMRELDVDINLIDFICKSLPDSTFHNIASNHNTFVDRWLRNTDWRKARNKKAYLELANIVASGEAKQGVFNYLLNKRLPEVKTYGYGDSLRIMEWELGLHGDMGANGSRGSIKQFKNLPMKTISGHSHSPQREDGSIVVGTLTKLRLGYNVGLSSWLNGVAIIYPNGKATNIHIINGKYTTL